MPDASEQAAKSDSGQSTGPGPGHVTRVLRESAQGRPGAAAELLPLVYDALCALARQRMAQERAGHTLQATALVHEAYLRLVRDEGHDAAGATGPAGGAGGWAGRAHFYAAAAEAMRRILIEHARARGRVKRGGDGAGRPMSLQDLTSVADLAAAEQRDPAEILAVDEAIRRLEQQSPDVGAIVRLRFYAGLTAEETAESLGISVRTVHREWSYARAWLYRELKSAGL